MIRRRSSNLAGLPKLACFPSNSTIDHSGVRTGWIFLLWPMRALSFLFALMVGLALAFFAPAMAGGRGQAPEAMLAPEAVQISEASNDQLAMDGQITDFLVTDLLAELSIDLAPALDDALDGSV